MCVVTFRSSYFLLDQNPTWRKEGYAHPRGKLTRYDILPSSERYLTSVTKAPSEPLFVQACGVYEASISLSAKVRFARSVGQSDGIRAALAVDRRIVLCL